MLTQEQLTIGNWYHLPEQTMFELVAMDEDTKLLEVQYFDGTVAEFEMVELLLSGLRRCAAPVDFAGAYEESGARSMSNEISAMNEQELEQISAQGRLPSASSRNRFATVDDWNGVWS